MTRKSSALLVLTAVILAFFEASCSPFLSPPWREFRPVLVALVLGVVYRSPRGSFLIASIAGCLMPLFSLDNDFAFMRYLAVSGVLVLLNETVFTNYSLYSALVAMVSARLLDICLVIAVQFLQRTVFGLDGLTPSVSLLPWTFVWDIGTVSIVFISTTLLAKRFVSLSPRSTLYGA